MATINPTSEIRIFTGVPLDPSYRNTLYFADLSAQLSYFTGLTPLATLTANMYTRVTNGIFEAKTPIENVYDANYMMFRNSGFENKWFFAFVTKVEYINNNNTRITFEVDVMQTWMHDITLLRSFIERQHSQGDIIGAHILPEPVSLGEYVYTGYGQLLNTFNRYAVLIMIVSGEAGQSSNGGFFENVFSGAQLYAVDAESEDAVASINNFLQERNPKPEQVINMYMVPLYLLPIPPNSPTREDGYSQVRAVPSDSPIGAFTVQASAITDTDTFQGYRPKNKKLYTYPYNFYHVDNGDAAGLNLRYEFFENLIPRAKIEGCLTTPVQLRLTPYNYKGITAPNVEDRAEFLTISGYPLCSWNFDTYRAWVAQNSVPMEISAGMLGSSLLLAGLTGGASAAWEATVPIVTGAAGAASRAYQASENSNVCRGNVNSGNVNFAHKKQTFYGGRCHVTADYAEMIDHFFTMFGYAINKYGIPNTHSRPHWNYVKTTGANIIGNCPADDLVRIKQIFDNGITFWKNASEVGSYHLDNSPT